MTTAGRVDRQSLGREHIAQDIDGCHDSHRLNRDTNMVTEGGVAANGWPV